MTSVLDDEVAVRLRMLAASGSPAVTVAPELAQAVLRRRRNRRRTGRGAAGVLVTMAAGAAITAALLPGHAPYVTVDEPSAAMSPTIQVGEHVIVAKHLTPSRGDVVEASISADGERFTTLSRVIGIGGDTVACPAVGQSCAGVVVDGRPLDETYLNGPTAPFATVTVPSGMVFLMGDNRALANDSRQLGPVSLSQLRGVVVRILRAGTSTQVPGAPANNVPGGHNVDPPGPPPTAGLGSAPQ
jgi:signal peptidase I